VITVVGFGAGISLLAAGLIMLFKKNKE